MSKSHTVRISKPSCLIDCINYNLNMTLLDGDDKEEGSEKLRTFYYSYATESQREAIDYVMVCLCDFSFQILEAMLEEFVANK